MGWQAAYISRVCPQYNRELVSYGHIEGTTIKKDILNRYSGISDDSSPGVDQSLIVHGAIDVDVLFLVYVKRAMRTPRSFAVWSCSVIGGGAIHLAETPYIDIGDSRKASKGRSVFIISVILTCIWSGGG